VGDADPKRLYGAPPRGENESDWRKGIASGPRETGTKTPSQVRERSETTDQSLSGGEVRGLGYTASKLQYFTVFGITA